MTTSDLPPTLTQALALESLIVARAKATPKPQALYDLADQADRLVVAAMRSWLTELEGRVAE